MHLRVAPALVALLMAVPLAAKDDSATNREAPAPVVTVGTPKFTGGEVKLIGKMLEKTRPGVAQCVAKHGGLKGKVGSVHVQFLVRVRGRAEGVEVLRAKGVGKQASRCVRKFLKNRWVGTPTEDPVGVEVTYALTAK